MKRIYYSIISLVVFSLSACYSDKSVGEINDISSISPVTQLQETYTVGRWDTLKIKAPEVSQAFQNKELRYSWEVNYKEVSTEKDLVYVCAEFGKYPIRLKISNEDGAYYYNSSVDVQYSYLTGVYALAEHEGKSVVSYIPDQKHNKPNVLDVFKVNNPEESLAANPKAIGFYEHRKRVLLYIATGNPSSLYRLDANLMSSVAKLDFEGEITGFSAPYKDQTINFFLNGRVTQLEHNKLIYTNYAQQNMEGQFGAVNFYPNMLSWYPADVNYINGQLYFDNEESRLIAIPSASGNAREILSGSFTNHTALGLDYLENSRKALLVTKDNSTNKVMMYWIFPGFYKRNTSGSGNPAAEIEDTQEIPSYMNVTDNTIFRTSTSKNMLYVSDKNKIYAYNVISKGNFTSSPLFTLDEGEEIADIRLNRKGDQMYVATNTTGSESLKGNIYMFDLNTNMKVWKKGSVSGKIHTIAYREE